MDIALFRQLLTLCCRVQDFRDDTLLFENGLGISSISFTELVMLIEEKTGADIDLDQVNYNTVTVRDLFILSGGNDG
jgi:acyl carrier protein